MEGLRFKTWRMRAGEWFEGCYVFETSAPRGRVPERVHAPAPPSRPARGSSAPHPVLIEPCEVVAVAEGAAGFRAAPSYA